MELVASSAAQSAMGTLLRKLGDLVAERYTLLGGMNDEIQELKDELESMTACFRDVAGIGDDDMHKDQVRQCVRANTKVNLKLSFVPFVMRTWMKQVREIGYDAEDCIDIFLHHLSKHSGTLKVRLKLVTEIQSIKSRAQKVSERRLRYKLDAMDMKDNMPSSSSYVDVDRRLPALHGDESPLVGMAENKQKVIDLLNKDDMKLRAISVVGIGGLVGSGGLGKTTLALTVYNSPTVKAISTRAFVAVSQNYDLHILLQSLLTQLIGNASGPSSSDPLRGIETWHISELIGRCRTHLEDKRYFIVLDDLWSLEDWANLKVAFPNNDKQSRILITTRNRNVAEHCCSDAHDLIYNMEPLPFEESKKLFYKKVFKSDECPPLYHDLDVISNSILKKCSGLPLAIVSIGGMLARTKNKTIAEWEKVCDRLGSGLETSATMEGMRRILSLGYHDLPYNLKACFLYLSVFPEEYEIKRGPLFRRWAAEGFISGMHETNLEEVAAKYLDEFVNRSIVTPTRIASTGLVKSCKVHDIMLDVITSKSIQENFISFMGNQQHSTTGHDKIRRLSIQTDSSGSNKEQGNHNINFSHARSLSILCCSKKPLLISFSHFKLLRVLELEGCWWLSNEDLKDICKMSLLRYLCLRRTNVSQLPKQVGALKELVTLDIRETSIRELPDTVTELGNLKHLLGGRYRHYTRISRVKLFEPHEALIIPRGLKNMKSIQKIAHVDIAASSHAMQELGALSQLTKLCAMSCEYGGEQWKSFSASLNMLCKSLRHLSIIHWHKSDMGLETFLELKSPPIFLEQLYLWGRLSVLPPWILSLSYLVELSLRENFFDGELLRQLGKLPSLVSLKLYHESFVGTKLCFEPNLFPRLKQLIVDNAPNLDELRFDGGAPNLEMLTLAFEREPAKGIFGIENLPRLKEVEFFGEVIFDSLVEEMIAEAQIHPNRPRVYREN
ncbi:hypothetical protein HU200_021195 [Digitaria exilis]|uniref:Uncharacterized protein n=1 Tax=Digitaria exilis TaxID=1010633 RepID=A0A835EZZ2_9POAL|nr:hypothetical protein HU200_021195 [Digitaria exilis]